MAINVTCWKCNAEFITKASNYGGLCHECDGTNEAKRKEQERWLALPLEQKVEELRQAVLALEQRSQWDGRIG